MLSACAIAFAVVTCLPLAGGVEAPVRRVAAATLVEGRLELSTEWRVPSVRGGCGPIASYFDCYEGDALGNPIGGDACGYATPDARPMIEPSSSYSNTMVIGDFTVAPGSELGLATQARFAFWWQAGGAGTSESCAVAILTSETFDDSCADGVPGGAFGGVVYDLGVLESSATSGSYYFIAADLCGTGLAHRMPSDGGGAVTIMLLRSAAPLEFATAAQPMLWGTGDAETPADGRAGSQGPRQWDDVAPADGSPDAPAECVDYTRAGECPAVLGAMLEFRGPPRSAGSSGLWTREEAVGFALAGVPISAGAEAWSPYMEFGFGVEHEGCLPAGALVEEGRAGGAGLVLNGPAYFVWIDDDPNARFEHGARFVLVDADRSHGVPILGAGIEVASAAWWPRVVLPDGSALELYSRMIETASDRPASPDNPQGLVAGVADSPSEIKREPASGPGDQTSGAYALVVVGSTEEFDEEEGKRAVKSLRDTLKIKEANLVVVSKGKKASHAEFSKAMDLLVDKVKADPGQTPTVYLRLLSHGGETDVAEKALGKFYFGNAAATDEDLRKELLKLVKLEGKKVRIHVMVDACFSGPFADTLTWDLLADSISTSSTDSLKKTYGGSFKIGDALVTGTIFGYWWHTYLADPDADADKKNGVDDYEAVAWMYKKDPSCKFRDGPSRPADSKPQRRYVGAGPMKTGGHVKNGTGANQVRYTMVFRGRHGGSVFGASKIFKSDADMKKLGQWGNEDSLSFTYSDARDETVATWRVANDAIPAGGYILIEVETHETTGLQVVRQNWGADRSPSLEAVPSRAARWSAGAEDDASVFRIEELNRPAEAGGWGASIQTDYSYRVSDLNIPIESLNLDDDAVATLPNVRLGDLDMPEGTIRDFALASPSAVRPCQFVVAIARTSWGENSNTLTQVDLLGPMPGPSCRADLTGDGVLNVFDFLAFQTLFVNESPCVDMGSPMGVFNVFDFLAYQIAFAEGCE